VIRRPPEVGAFQFVVLSALRAAQLTRGCRPRVDGMHKAIVIAQAEVAQGKVTQLVEALETPIGVQPA
jgi:DNA-directed RNA polymerase subunit K/omega